LRPVEAGAEGVVLELVPLPRISGRVVNSQGAAVTSFTLSLVLMSDPDRPPVVHTVAAPDGAFYIPLRFRGDWGMRVEADGFGAIETALEGMQLGEERALGDIVLVPASWRDR